GGGRYALALVGLARLLLHVGLDAGDLLAVLQHFEAHHASAEPELVDLGLARGRAADQGQDGNDNEFAHVEPLLKKSRYSVSEAAMPQGCGPVSDGGHRGKMAVAAGGSRAGWRPDRPYPPPRSRRSFAQ